MLEPEGGVGENLSMRILPVVFLVLFTSLAGAKETRAREIVLDGCDYASNEAARRTWNPTHKLTPPVEVARSGDRKVLVLPYNFSKNTNWRVRWDRDGSWDLSDAREVRLRVTESSGRGARMLMYFRSGEGWYAGSFSVPGGTSTVRLSPRGGTGSTG
jgi:hypothetical protein